MEQETYKTGEPASEATAPNFVIIEEAAARTAQSAAAAQPAQPAAAAAKPGKKWGRQILAGLLVVLLGLGSGYGGGLLAARQTEVGTGPANAVPAVTIKPSDNVNTAEAIAQKVIPSVVGISTTTKVISQDVWGMLNEGNLEGVGTGMIVDSNGYILTNAHVISGGQADNITVQLSDNKEYKGRVLWNDSAIDLAIVKIEATGLKAVELGDSDTVKIGSYAVAIGNPLGMEFDRSVTQGVISGLNRTITVSNQDSQSRPGFSSQGNTVTMEGLMQTDASINSGNSGGPLLNSVGQVIGINSAKAASAEGLGFAIPINLAKPIIEEIKQSGTFKKAFMGISGVNMADYQKYYPDDKLGTDTGVYIREIGTGSPAELGGMKVGDVIVSLNDKKIETMNQLTRDLFAYRPGDSVTVRIYRDRHPLDLTIRLGTSLGQK